MTTTIGAAAALPVPRSRERTFYTTMSFAMLGAVLLGFARSFYLHPLFPAHPAPAEPFFAIHGLAFTLWVLLLPAQALLIANRRADLHRAFGVAGVALAIAMIVLGLEGAAIGASRPGGFVGIPMPGWAFMIVPVAAVAQFAAFVAMAVAKRRDAQAHKRWMLLATIAILSAAIARWPGVQEVGNPLLFFAINDLFLVPLVVRDLNTRGRLHPATLWGGIAFVVSQPLQLGLATTEGWHAVANALIGALT